MDNSNNTPAAAPVKPAPRLRLWPALPIIALQAAVYGYVRFFGATTLFDAVGNVLAPLAAMLLLLLWWLALSRVPLRQRAVGLLLFAATLAWIFYFHRPNGVFMLIRAMPFLCIGVVAAFALTYLLPWKHRRWAGAAVLLACAVVFSLLRYEGVTTRLVPVVAWRWASEPLNAPAELPAASTASLPITLPSEPGPGDWPAFRGPARDGRLDGVRFSANWETPPEPIWRHGVGRGWSSFCAVGDYLFTQEQRGPDEMVVCYEAATGNEVWANAVETFFEDPMGPGPRATPTFDKGQLFTLGATGTFQCIDASTGESIWRADIKKDADAGPPQWGFASSPLLMEDLAIVYAGGKEGKCVLAYKRETGELAWSAGDGKPGYSSPQLAVLADTPQVLMSSSAGIEAFSPDGQFLWHHLWPVGNNPRVVQPAVLPGDTVLLGTAGGLGTRALAVTHAAEWEAAESWTTRAFRPYFNDYVLYQGNCYGFDGDRLTCIDAATGESRWQGERCGGQVLLVEDMGILLILTEKGQVLLVEANPESCNELARFDALTGKTWNHPVIAHGNLYVRNDREAACFALPQ